MNRKDIVIFFLIFASIVFSVDERMRVNRQLEQIETLERAVAENKKAFVDHSKIIYQINENQNKSSENVNKLIKIIRNIQKTL